MKKAALLFVFTILLCFYSSAQQFSKAAGIRGGLSSGFEYRTYTDDTNSYKILLSASNNSAQLTLMKEFHRYDLIGFSEQLVFIMGVGLHAGFERWHKKHYNIHNTWYEARTSFIAGLDGLAALEYTFYELPLCAGLEVKPYFNALGSKTFDLELFDFAFTVKYLF